MTEFRSGDDVVVFYFNSSSGKPNEMRLQVSEVLQDGYLLERTLGDAEYRFEESGKFYLVEGDGSQQQISTDASLSEPRN